MTSALLIILGAFFFAVMTAISQHLAGVFHPIFIVALRNSCALIGLMPMIVAYWKELCYTLHFPHIRNLLMRAGVGQVATSCWFLGASTLSLPMAMSISFITPLLTTLAAIIALKEKVTKWQWTGLIIGFMGVLVILKPGLTPISPGTILVFSATLCWAINNVIIKFLSTNYNPFIILIGMMGGMTLFSLPFMVFYWQPIPITTVPWIIALGITTNCWQLSISYAYRKSTVAFLQPFDFSKLIFASVIGYLSFGEVLQIHAYVGTFIILLSATYTTWQEKRHHLVTSL